jgi:hypothetical protein
MHDIDLTRLRADEDDEFDEFEDEGFDDEDEMFEAGGDMLDEEEELELAGELLEVSTDAELDEFIGKLFKKAVKGIKSFAKSKVGRALGSGLKSLAKTALPIAGRALGNFVLPGVGGVVGGKLASMATKLFEFEAEGMNEEEIQLEMARRFVRLATAATRTAARAPRRGSPRVVAHKALQSAAKAHAPGLIRSRALGGPSHAHATYSSRPVSGRWFRRGHKIVLVGV